MVAYGATKTANLLFSVALRKRLEKRGITGFALNPGIVMSEGAKPIFDMFDKEALKFLFVKNLDQGASTTIVAACDPGLNVAGCPAEIYLDDCQIANAMDSSTDEAAAERLWKLSEKIVGEEFAL